MTAHFDWKAEESAVLPKQLAIAVSLGERGDVVIRQEGQYGISEDSFICVRPHYAVNLCAAILREAGLAWFEIVQVPFNENEIVGRDGNRMHMPKSERDRFDPVCGKLLDCDISKDPTAVQRKRRQRARRRDATVTVTPAAPRLRALVLALQVESTS